MLSKGNLFLRCECQRQTLLRRFSAVQRNRFQTAWLRHEKHHLFSCSPLAEKKLWTEESAQNPPEYDFQAMKSNDRQIHDAILSLEKHGLILLRNCGTEGNFVLELANLMAAGPYPSVFGPAVAPVISTQSGHYSDFIYTANEILLHTDLPVYRNVPPVLVMHSIETADWGGESLALDGFLAAEQLRQADPSAFNLLCEIPILFRGTGNEYVDFYLEAWHPIIRTGKLGQLVQLCFNNSRAPRIALKHKDRLGDWYKAFYRLSHQIQRESNPLAFKRLLTPGSAIVVDNHRVLHGRSQMRLDNGKRRVLNTIYFDWDGVRAKGRTLELNM